MNRVPESYVQFVWRYSLYQGRELTTSAGEAVEVIHPGLQNYDAGPDFSNARLSIGGQSWAGNVEIHFRSSDWIAHKHQHDPAYDSVILHVVVEHDQEVQNSLGTTLPCLVLGPYLATDRFTAMDEFMNSRQWIPCAQSVSEVDELRWVSIKERMALERLGQKSQAIIERYEQQSKDWETVAYQLIARAMGGKVNSDPFEQLCHITPLAVLRKHSDSAPLLEAILLGQAGVLSDIEAMGAHEERLCREYSFAAHKYGLKPMNPVAWKNARIRPSSSPQLRIVQFARLWAQTGSWHSAINDAPVDQLRARFSITLDGYWENHIALQNLASTRKRSIGDSLIDRMLINVVVPMRFAYGVYTKNQHYKDSALSLLESVKQEDNSVVRHWRLLGLQVEHAMDSQGLLQLKRHMCDQKQCLSCTVGQVLLRQ